MLALVLAAALILPASAQMRSMGGRGAFPAPVRIGVPPPGRMFAPRIATVPRFVPRHGVFVGGFFNPFFPHPFFHRRFIGNPFFGGFFNPFFGGRVVVSFGDPRFKGRFHGPFFRSRFCAFNPGFCVGRRFGAGFSNPAWGFAPWGYGYGGGYAYSVPYPVTYPAGGTEDARAALAEQQRVIEDLQAEIERMREAEEEREAPPPPAPSSPQATAPPERVAPTTLVFRDGRRLEVTNYAAAGDVLYVMDPQQSRKISLSELDVAATVRENQARGVKFHAPGES
ncbi:MAG: hypothetical protein ACE14L_04115 [Terriglobales bacterium]